MGRLLTPTVRPVEDGGPPPGRYARALAEHPEDAPITCTGCALWEVGCDLARQAAPFAPRCPSHPMRRAGYFAEMGPVHAAKYRRSGCPPPPPFAERRA